MMFLYLNRLEAVAEQVVVEQVPVLVVLVPVVVEQVPVVVLVPVLVAENTL
jgi:hypothetical protein